jgi:hypothetical protein
MSVFPFALDGDTDIIRIDDNITETGGEALNQCRDAIFALQRSIGIQPAGSAGSLATRLNVSFNPDGTIKTSALTSVGLVTIPISDNQVGVTAGIKEYKLALDHTTSDLYTLILANSALLNALTTFANTTNSDLNTHIAGGSLLTDGSPARHVASHIDLNADPFDARDLSFVWSGLFDKNGIKRTAQTVVQALDQINTDLINHENAIVDAHVASAINLDVDNFQEIPQTVDTVQKLADHLDDFEVITIADHRATQHSAGVPKIGRITSSYLPDGYGQNVVANTPVYTYRVTSPNISPVDSVTNGDDLVSFQPVNNSDFSFDAQFSQVKVGDVIRINYGGGFETSFKVESIRFTPGTEWVVRINGTNLLDSLVDGYASARIDRSLFDRDTVGVLAVAAANATPIGFSFDSMMQSVIVGHPRGAVALGNGFDPGQLDATHYNLYLELYPTGNPLDRVITMPAIDVTGNAGTTVGGYSLDSVIHETNKKLREIGYNLRFIVFAHHGNFAIMLADAINNVSFSITSGSISTGALGVGAFTNNVIGDADLTGFDALGFGSTHANLASPAFGDAFIAATAQMPTKVIVPFNSRDYIVDGQRRDDFAPTWMASTDANGDSYWDGYISNRVVVGAFTVETTYTVPLDLCAAGLKPGMTLVVQPAVALTNANYFDVDYGRFIIKSIVIPSCGGVLETLITVISGIYAAGTGVAFSSGPQLGVKLYFGEDSVSFNYDNIIDASPSANNYHRLHEVFVSSEGRTFGHERARMPVQSGSGTLINTATWHIEDVSPKLLGYRDSAITFNKYLRLRILSYDAASGEYTGYVGEKGAGIAVLSTGPITTGRKNVPTRFYDETNVDYIDIIFVEDAATLATAQTLSADTIVDIEIFDSLQLNDDLLLLATVEVNWEPESGQEVIQRVTNRRQFGSVDAEDFTESAIDFITAGDRSLHDNGIIRGFDFDSINASDDREIFYKGGVALVNGRILTTNALSVTIPEMSENLAGLPDVIDWAICVNEDGFLEPILLTSVKTQFFARDNTLPNSTYYVPSVTFMELVETRKDLVPIAVVSATIASITINNSDVYDVRRFVDDGVKRELVYSPSNFAGTFHTAMALVNWVNSYASTSPVVVKVRGEFNISSPQNFSGLTSGLILDGDGAIFNVTVAVGGATLDSGFILGSNITFRNITFNYNPVITAVFVTNDKINGATGCLYSSGDVSNITIENCIFNSDAAAQRPPFISLEIDKGDVIENLNISNNRFNDSGGDPADKQSAIAIVSLNSVGIVSSEPAVVYRARITDNVCNRSQGIYLLQETLAQVAVAASVDGPGIRTFDVIISGNSCGAIGFITTSLDSTASVAITGDRTSGLIIENNTANIIATMTNARFAAAVLPGTVIVSQFEYVAGDNHLASPFPGGNVRISGNNCNLIVNGVTDISNDNYVAIIIDNNTITATDPTYLDNWRSVVFFGANQLCGINVSHSADNIGDIIISNNILIPGLFDSIAYEFNIGILSEVSATINNNIIRGIVAAGFGIHADSITLGKQYIITNNQIFRTDSVAITQFIWLDRTDNQVSGLCVDNYFNSPFIAGDLVTGPGSTATINTDYADTWIVERNKNQTETYEISGRNGLITNDNNGVLNDYLICGSNVAPATLMVRASRASVPNDIILSYAPAAAEYFNWHISLYELLPPGVQIIDVTVIGESGSVFTAGTFEFRLCDSIGTLATGAPVIEFETTVGPTTSSITGTAASKNTAVNRLYLRLATANVAGIQDAVVSTDITFNGFVVTYRW